MRSFLRRGGALTFSHDSNRLIVNVSYARNAGVYRGSLFDLLLVKVGNKLRDIICDSHFCREIRVDEDGALKGVRHPQEGMFLTIVTNVGLELRVGEEKQIVCTNPVKLPFKNGLGRTFDNELAIDHWNKNEQTEEAFAIDVLVYSLKSIEVHLHQALEGIGFIGATNRGLINS